MTKRTRLRASLRVLPTARTPVQGVTELALHRAGCDHLVGVAVDLGREGGVVPCFRRHSLFPSALAPDKPPPMAHPRSSILIPDETRTRLAGCETVVRAGSVQPSARLAAALESEADFTTALLCTKLPQIFAESAVTDNGSDWKLTELGLLGDISVAMDVTVFDDGRHSGPEVFDEPFEAGLVFVPRALLRSGGPTKPADWDEVVDSQGRIDPEA